MRCYALARVCIAHDGKVSLVAAPHLLAGTFSGYLQPRLTGSTVALRPWADADVPTLVQAYADREIQRWHCRSLEESDAAAMIRQGRCSWAAETGASWAVTSLDDDRVIARVAFREVDLADGFAEVGYWVLPSARGRGVVGDAVTTLSTWALQTVGLQRVAIQHSVQNTASCRVAVTCGFVAEGTARASVLHTDGWHDMHVHGRLRTDVVGRRPPT